METSDFDKIFREKVKQADVVYEAEAERSKPHVWAAVEKELETPAVIVKWYYLAAAVLLILLGTSSLFFYSQQQHAEELRQFSKQLESIKQQYEKQDQNLQAKNEELNCLQSEFKLLEQELIHQESTDRVEASPIYVYHKDTVYIKELEIINQNLRPHTNESDTVISSAESLVDLPQTQQEGTNQSNELIYPKFNSTTKSKESNLTLKIKVNSIATN